MDLQSREMKDFTLAYDLFVAEEEGLREALTSTGNGYLCTRGAAVVDVQGGTTKEGIHMGVMSGTLDLIQRGFVGSEIRDGVLYFDPKLPDRLEGLSFALQFRRTPLRVTLSGGELTVIADAEGFSRPVRVGVGDEVCELCAGDRWVFQLRRESNAER